MPCFRSFFREFLIKKLLNPLISLSYYKPIWLNYDYFAVTMVAIYHKLSILELASKKAKNQHGWAVFSTFLWANYEKLVGVFTYCVFNCEGFGALIKREWFKVKREWFLSFLFYIVFAYWQMSAKRSMHEKVDKKFCYTASENF